MMHNLLKVCAAYLILVSPSAFIDAHSWVEKVESIYGTGMSRFGMDTKSDVSQPPKEEYGEDPCEE